MLTAERQRSADISMISGFQKPEAKEVHPPVITQAMIEAAAIKQFQVGLLYWHQLDKPDSAIADMQLVVDSFPATRIAPRAMLALSQMIREQNADTASADSIARLIPLRYPRSDYLPEILMTLGLKGTEADTGYAEVFIKRAEDFWVDSGQVDSARYWYQYVIDSFRDRPIRPARFANIWFTENIRASAIPQSFLRIKLLQIPSPNRFSHLMPC